jgi:TorA maturation chaperone TorD
MEIFRALGTLVEPPAPEHEDLARLLELGEPPEPSVFSDLFLFQLYPYASVYLGPEGMMGGEARDRIAGFWRALDESPPRECDHLAPLLALYARLAELEEEAEGEERRAAWRNARRAYFWEHMASWLPLYADKLKSIAPPYYQRWAALVESGLQSVAEALEPLDTLPRHLAVAPRLAAPEEEGGEAFLTSLLAPAQSGFIVVRSDLERAARDLGLGLRAGERRYALRAFLEQAPEATLEWLGREAAVSADRHARWAPRLGETARFWEVRARHTSKLLARLAASV